MLDIWYGGSRLSEFGVVSDVQKPLLQKDVALIDVAGMDGAYAGNVNLTPIEITMLLTIYGKPTARASKLHNLATLLNGGLQQLLFEDDGVLYYMAYAQAGEIERFADGVQVELTFTCPDPAMYGSKMTRQLSAGGTTNLPVGGNYPTKPIIRCDSATNGDGGVWGVRLNSQDFAYVALEASDVAVEIDCENRTAKEGSVTTLITLDSDWLVLNPNFDNRMTLDQGSGVVTVEWTERWI